MQHNITGEYSMPWYGMVNDNLYSAIITKVSNALYVISLTCYKVLCNGTNILSNWTALCHML